MYEKLDKLRDEVKRWMPKEKYYLRFFLLWHKMNPVLFQRTVPGEFGNDLSRESFL